MKKFFNLSNHPSARWDNAQKAAAEAYGEIRDIPFPNVPPTATHEDISRMADELVSGIDPEQTAAVMCQGEMTLVHSVVSRLQALGVKVVAACSERRVEEPEPGKKIAVFSFVQFREY